MSFDDSHIWLAVGTFCVLMTSSVAAPTQTAPQRVMFQVSGECSSPDAVEMLREAIAVRLGEQVELVGSQQQYAVSWTPSSSGCRLLVETPSTTTPVSLASKSDPDAIRNAASRAVWLLANAEPRTQPEPKPSREPESAPEQPTDEPDADPAPSDEVESVEAAAREAARRAAAAAEQASEALASVTPVPPEPEPVPEPEPAGEPEEEPVAKSDAEPDADTQTNARSQRSGARDRSEPRYNEVNVRFGLFPGMGTPFTRGPHVSRMAFNIIGWQAGVRELEFGLVANIDTDFVQGAQFAGGANVSLGRTDGLAVAGLTNISSGVHNGQQISGLFNFANRLDGLQVSAVNLSGEAMDGGQVGAVNIASAASGVQLGAVNVGRRVEGLQFGLVNIAADSDYSLGLLNINYQRPLHVDLWATELGANFVGLRHGSRYVQWMVATGVRPRTSSSRALWSAGIGLGVHMPLDERERFFLESDLVDYVIFAPDPNSDNVAMGNHLQFRLNGGWRLAKRFAIFAGGSLNLLFSDTSQTDAVTMGGPLVFESGVDSTMTALWPGFQAGVRF